LSLYFSFVYFYFLSALSGYPSAQGLWRLRFPIHRRVRRFSSRRVFLFRKSRDPNFWILFGPPPEPSAHHAIRIHPNDSVAHHLHSHPILFPLSADISYRPASICLLRHSGGEPALAGLTWLPGPTGLAGKIR
jgi:hypothetical protein